MNRRELIVTGAMAAAGIFAATYVRKKAEPDAPLSGAEMYNVCNAPGPSAASLRAEIYARAHQVARDRHPVGVIIAVVVDRDGRVTRMCGFEQLQKGESFWALRPSHLAPDPGLFLAQGDGYVDDAYTDGMPTVDCDDLGEPVFGA